MAKPNAEALKLPDELLVRYFRAGEIEHVSQATVKTGRVSVILNLAGGPRTDHWRDLGGGLGYVPDTEG